MPPKEEIKWIKDEALACPIAAVELAANEGGKKRSFSPSCESSAEKKPVTSSATRGSSFVAVNLVIDLTSPKRQRRPLSLSL